MRFCVSLLISIAAADLMTPVLSTGMLVGVSSAPAGTPQPLMAPHKAAVCTLFSRAHYKWVVLLTGLIRERHQMDAQYVHTDSSGIVELLRCSLQVSCTAPILWPPALARAV